jgi:hypothetical protein
MNRSMEIEHERHKSTDSDRAETKRGHPILLDGILEQPAAASRALNYGARLLPGSAKLLGLDSIENELVRYRHIIFNALGSSRHAVRCSTVS